MELEQKTKIGFFEQIVFSVQPKKYKELVLLPKKTVVFYMILLGLCLSIMNYVIPMTGWMVSFGGLDHLLREGLPRIEFSNGQLSVSDRVEIGKDTPQHLLVDTSKEKVTADDFDQKKYVMEILVSKTNMMIYANMAGTMAVDFSMYKDATLTNESLIEMKPAMYTVMVMQFFFNIIREIIHYLIAALPLAFLAWIVGGADRKNRMKFSRVFVLTLYAKTAAELFISFNASANLLKNPFILAYVGMFLTIMLLIAGLKRAEEETK